MTTQLQYGMEGDRPYSLYYQHSGKTPLASILFAALAGIVAGIVLAFAYAYVDAYCPYAKGRGLACVIFGAGIGGATAAIAKAGKIRSLAVVLALVGAVAVISYYFCWVFWIQAALARFADSANGIRLPGYARLILSPLTLARYIQLFNDNGYWTMSSTDKDAPHGLLLSLFWLAEAATILGAAIAVAYSTTRANVFCESCNAWGKKPVTLRTTAPGDPVQLRQTLETHNFTYLNSLGPATDAAHYWSLVYEYCGNCDKLHALTIKDHTNKIDKKGVVRAKKVKTLVERLLLDTAELNTIRNATATVVVPPPPNPSL